MGWTKWRKIAEGTCWFDDCFDYDGPACYELGTGGPRGGDIRPHYVGETISESGRISQYARNGSHLRRTIDWHLRQGWSIYYRAIACPTKCEAKELQDRLLQRYIYDWNVVSNGHR